MSRCMRARDVRISLRTIPHPFCSRSKPYLHHSAWMRGLLNLISYNDNLNYTWDVLGGTTSGLGMAVVIVESDAVTVGFKSNLGKFLQTPTCISSHRSIHTSTHSRIHVR
ncbi:hypothetical protein PENSPDRAFT_657707 [Peniophora sp. CONT]|nr:hypothetical protein PENSPDRAFT_657707 [Peniophora sp. CONT]